MTAGTGRPLRGRPAELAAIEAAVVAAKEGRGTVELIEAGPGLGKTRLLDVHQEVRVKGNSSAGEAVGDANSLGGGQSDLLKNIELKPYPGAPPVTQSPTGWTWTRTSSSRPSVRSSRRMCRRPRPR